MALRLSLSSACLQLGLCRTDRRKDIREKYKALCSKYNPERIAENQVSERIKKNALEKYNRIKEAYSIVKKEKLVDIYDSMPEWRAEDLESNFLCNPGNQGRLVWEEELGGQIVGAPAMADDLLLVSSDDKRIYALDSVKGTIKWKFHTGAEAPSPPSIEGNKVFVTTRDHDVFAIDFKTQNLIWNNNQFCPIGKMPLVYGGKVYVETSDKRLVVLNCWDGSVRSNWKLNQHITGNLKVINDSIVYITGKFLKMLDPATDSMKSIELSARARSSPAGYGSRIAYFDVYNHLRVDTEDKWDHWTKPASESFSPDPIVVDGILYTTMRLTDLYAVDLELQKILWRFKAGNFRDTSPTLFENTIYVGLHEGMIVGIRRNSVEEELWYNTGQSEKVSSPVVYQDNIFFGCGNKIYSIKPPKNKAEAGITIQTEIR